LDGVDFNEVFDRNSHWLDVLRQASLKIKGFLEGINLEDLFNRGNSLAWPSAREPPWRGFLQTLEDLILDSPLFELIASGLADGSLFDRFNGPSDFFGTIYESFLARANGLLDSPSGYFGE